MLNLFQYVGHKVKAVTIVVSFRGADKSCSMYLISTSSHAKAMVQNKLGLDKCKPLTEDGETLNACRQGGNLGTEYARERCTTVTLHAAKPMSRTDF